jgi:hypothetical protein
MESLSSSMIWKRRLGFPALLLIAFVVSRGYFHLAGNIFQMNLGMYQYADIALLRSDLLRTLYYFHAQPPFFNLFLATGLRLFPQSYVEFFQVTFWLLGVVLVISLYLLMVELGVLPLLAFFLVLLFELSPGTMMVESWFYNTYPTAVLLCVAALCLLHFLRTRRVLFCCVFVFCAGAPILINSTFQLAWLLVLVPALWFTVSARQLTQIMKVAIPLVLIVVVLYLKNLFIFGTFASSSWLGMNLATMSVERLDLSQRRSLVTKRDLSAVSLTAGPFSALGEFSARTPNTGIPVLDETRKSGGELNFNNLAYIDISREYLRDDLWVIRHRPTAFIQGLLFSASLYVSPVGDYVFFHQAREKIEPWARFYRVLAKPMQLPWHPLLSMILGEREVERRLSSMTAASDVLRLGGPSIVLLLLFPTLITYCLVKLIRLGWNGDSISPESACLGFVFVAIAYSSALNLLFECGENNRLRYVIDPFYVLLAGLFLMDLGRFLRGRFLWQGYQQPPATHVVG